MKKFIFIHFGLSATGLRQKLVQRLGEGLYSGLFALASLVQGAFLVAVVVFGRRLAQRIDALQARIDRDITPALENLGRVSRAAAEIADLAALQARRLDLVLADTVEKIIAELIVTKHSERQLRVIDHDQDGSMELKKREGYF